MKFEDTFDDCSPNDNCKNTSSTEKCEYFHPADYDRVKIIRLMQNLSESLNGRGRTVDKLQLHLQELLLKLQREEEELLKRHE